MMRIDRRWIFLMLMVASAALFHFLDLRQYLSLSAIKDRQAELEAMRSAHPVLMAASFFACYVMVTALSFPGAVVMTLAAGAIFGLVWGTLLVSFASSIGATLAFLASRWLLSDWVRQRFGSRMEALNAGMIKDGGFYLFTLRLAPVLPFFVINLAMGLTNIRPLTFYWVSQLGMLAGTLVYVNAGTNLARINSLAGVISPGLIVSLALLGIFPLMGRKLIEFISVRKVYRGWTRPKRFDRNLIVIGAGSAGLVTSYIAAAVRAKVTLIERHHMGGDCLNTGCVPSKALIRSAKLLSHIQRSKEFGIRHAQADFDFSEVMARVKRVIQDIAPHDSVDRYRSLGVDVMQGNARIVTPWEVEVEQADGVRTKVAARNIVIAAGARPFVPPIPGIELVDVLTSDTIWNLKTKPDRLLVLGGGPIGCEMSQAFARLGSRVTQVEMASRLLVREDEDVSNLVSERFKFEGITVLTGHQAVRILVESGQKYLVAQHVGGTEHIAFDALLVAVGRTANLSGYGLEELGIQTARTVNVNAYLQTNFPNIYAAGDVAGPFQFTHAAAHQAWYAAVNALFSPFKRFKADYSVVPAATFIEPEVARVGLNENEAKAQGISYEMTRYNLDDLDRAIADQEAHGFVKVLTAPGKDRILGVTIVGEHAADLLAEYVLAMKHGIGLNKILGTIHTYPTLAEANKYAAGVWRRNHAPEQVLNWAARFHAWRLG